ncbi:MAG: hypothetical protein E6064_09080 [Peptoniphilus harei]|nr:hypothetical protein [Peptoniphilus harei]
MLEAKASIPTTSIAGGLFMLKRTKKLFEKFSNSLIFYSDAL